jgi:hypothetical protein
MARYSSVKLCIMFFCLGSSVGLGKAVAIANGSKKGVALESVANEADRAVLKVQNSTPFILTIYVAGIRAGWIKPFRTVSFKGFKAGQHKFYAFSQYGTTSWGPEEITIPGKWNLNMDQTEEPEDLDTALASKIFQSNKSSILACDKLAERRGENIKGGRIEFNVKVSASGQGVVEVSGDGMSEKLSSCYRTISKQWTYPQTGAAYQISFIHMQ